MIFQGLGPRDSERSNFESYVLRVIRETDSYSPMRALTRAFYMPKDSYLREEPNYDLIIRHLLRYFHPQVDFLNSRFMFYRK